MVQFIAEQSLEIDMHGYHTFKFERFPTIEETLTFKQEEMHYDPHLENRS